MDPLKIEEEKFQFSFEDEMDHPLKIEDEMEPLRNDDTMDLIMEMSNKKRQETLIDLRNCPPRESLRPVYPPFFPACYGAPWGGSGIEIGNNWILDHHVMMMMMMPEMSKEKTKKAMLIGLNHPRINNNTDDVKEKLLRMKVKLMELRGFTEDNITLMMDHDEQEEEEPIRKSLQPTQFNIQRTLSSLVHSARRGDILYIHLIAYGCSDGRIITSDKYHIHERFFKGLIVLACKRGYNLTLVSDCLVEPAACSCEEKRTTLFPSLGDDISLEERRKRMKEFLAMKHEVCISGPKSLQPLNLSYVDILNTPNEEKKKEDDDDFYTGVILLTSFRPLQNAATIPNPFCNVSELFIPPPNRLTEHTSYGVFTNAILDVIEETHGQVTNLELAQKAMKKLGRGIIPNLRCSDHNHAYTCFLC